MSAAMQTAVAVAVVAGAAVYVVTRAVSAWRVARASREQARRCGPSCGCE